MLSAYVLLPLSAVAFILAHSLTRALKTSGRRTLERVAVNVAEIALIFAVVAAIYSLASLIITSALNRSAITLSELHRFDEFLKHSRESFEYLRLTTWWFLLALLLLAAFGFIRAPETETAKYALLRKVKQAAFDLSNGLRTYRKFHKRLTIFLTFAVSFTFLPGMNPGDIERLVSARLQQAAKQLAEIDDVYQQTLAAAVAETIVDRSFRAMPPPYSTSLWRYPDSARRLDERIRALEKDYRVSLEPLHRELAPLVERFHPAPEDEQRKEQQPAEDRSQQLLAEALASDAQVTFGDLERVSIRLKEHQAEWENRRSKERLALDAEQAKAGNRASSGDLPREIVVEVAGALLAPKKIGPQGLRLALASVVAEYPWLEPLIDVVSGTATKVIAERVFDAAWQPLARLFERKSGDLDPVAAAVENRFSELAIVITPSADLLDNRGREVLQTVISDGSALAQVSDEFYHEQSRAVAALTESNRARIKALQEAFPIPKVGNLESQGSQADAAADTLDEQMRHWTPEQHFASRLGGTLWRIEEAEASPDKKRDWLHEIDLALQKSDPAERIADVTMLQGKIPRSSEANSEFEFGRGRFSPRGPGLGRTLDDILDRRMERPRGRR